MENENKPLEVVKHSKIALMFLGVMTISWTVVSVFGVIIPVLSTGDFNAAWIAHSRLNKNVELFFLALAWIPAAPFVFGSIKNAGTLFFYRDRMEVAPYLGMGKRIFPYEEIQVIVKNSRVVNIIRKDLPGWSRPWQRYKAEYLKGNVVAFPLRNIGNDHYTITAQNALKILRQRAGNFE